ncbi:bifunctional pantoate--beta-alanine ligase/(d)CMP kinase [Cyanobium gracile]|uniref:Bifunctional pantoate ligase/cytidylate kinase n=1 Tax=Cyanobium gracile UHCC 0281 TaxID=3110309 RepID=A0ABU5SSN9_9CYAN|nr:bifunctional pantoate--beta-alanine ligase/(d)CMP kinase [Cyanobium gracile]MEA5441392.1 bifunctional pantoate--beta-alanine ligase/(d)CMP kinase [Cyanobium gracile UHCC 0281]
MQLLQTLAELNDWRREQVGRPLHFVPTMGSLHQGHQQLLQRACAAVPAGRPAVLLSVFVNPLQFGPAEDFDRYPRDLAADAALGEAAGAEALFAPSVQELFPGGEAQLTGVVPPAALRQSLCGPGRPGHFEGVATVVCRLLALVRPDRLLLGEKDWQQLMILRRVVADLALPLTVQGCATVREVDGLACSSRHRYLRASERDQAAALPAALGAAQALWREGIASAALLSASVRRDLEAAGLAVEYVQLVQPSTLSPVTTADGGLVLLAAAARCGSTRLIDHLFLMNRPPIVAIDGPAGAGKSTVTRAFARRLGLLYLDTGAMYRALTWWVLHQGVDPADAAAIAPLLVDLDLQLESDAGGEQRVQVNGHEVSEAIRGPEVTAAVSAVAAHACVRAALTGQQQAMGQRGGLVAEGRDIGTAVFPEAECKVFLTATVAERARRRAADLAQRGFAVPPLAELEAQIAERDRLDSTRAEAPLRQAADAVELVTDGLGIDAVIQRLVDLFRERVPEDAWPGPGAP